MAREPVEQLVASVNEVAQTARTLVLGLLLAAITMAAIVVGTTDEAVLRNSVEAAPTLGVRISVSLAHLFAPIILLFLHVNTLIQLDVLGARWALLDAELKPEEWTHQRARLNSFAVVHNPVDTDDPWTRRVFRIMTWIAVIGLPLVVLLVLEVGFLRFQSDRITPIQQAVIVADTVILFWFLRRQRARQSYGSVRYGRRFPPLFTPRRFAMVIATLLALYWLQSHADYRYPALNYLHLAVLLVTAYFVVSFVWLPRNRIWLLLVVPIISLLWAWPPGSQEAKDIRWMTSFAYSDRRAEDTMPRQHNDSFPEGRCSIPAGGGEKSTWEHVFIWPAVKLCNPIDIYACPYLDWGCRYLRFANTIQISGAVPLSQLEGTNIMEPHQYRTMLVRAAGLRLRGRNLRYAEFKDASLFGADLIGAELQRANIEEGNLQRAWLDNADLSGAVLDDANLSYASLDKATIVKASLRDTILEKAYLSGATLVKSSLNRAQVKDADLRGADLFCVHARETSFVGANLGGASLANTDLEKADFSGADLRGVTLAGAKIKDVIFGTAHIDDATRLYAQMAGVQLGDTPPAHPPSLADLEEAAKSVAEGFKELACGDDRIGEGIIAWVSRSYDRAGATSKSWEGIAAKEILTRIKSAVEADLSEKLSGDDRKCRALNASVLAKLAESLAELEALKPHPIEVRQEGAGQPDNCKRPDQP